MGDLIHGLSNGGQGVTPGSCYEGQEVSPVFGVNHSDLVCLPYPTQSLYSEQDDNPMVPKIAQASFNPWGLIVGYIVSILAKKYDVPDIPTSDIIQGLQVQPEAKVIEYALYQTSSIIEAMNELTSRGYNEKAAFRHAIGFIFSRKTKPPKDVFLTDPSSYCWDITGEELKTLIEKYPDLTPKIIEHELQLLQRKVGRRQRSTVRGWIDTLQTMAITPDSKGAIPSDEIDVKKVNESLTTTQELLREVQSQKSDVVESTLKEWTRELALALDRHVPQVGQKEFTVSINSLGDVKIELLSGDPLQEIPKLRKAFLVISKKLEKDRALTEAEVKLLTRVIESNPKLDGTLDIKVAQYERQISASRIKIKIYKLALMKEGSGLRKALKVVEQCASRPWRLILPDGTRFKAQHVDGQLKIKTAPEFSFGPYRFKSYTALEIDKAGYKPVEILVFKDAYGEQNFITLEDYKRLHAQLRSMARLEGKDAPAVRESLSTLIHNLTIGWLSVDTDRTRVDTKSVQMASDAKLQTELNWARAIIGDLSDLVNKVNRHCNKCSFPVRERTMLNPFDVATPEDVMLKVNWIKEKFRPYFLKLDGENYRETTDSKQFDYLLDQLMDILGRQVKSRNTARFNGKVTDLLTQVRTLVQQRMVTRTGDLGLKPTMIDVGIVKSPNFFAEVDFWLKNGEKIAERGSLTVEEKAFLLTFAGDSALPPSLFRARQLFSQNSYMKALSEFLRFAFDSHTPNAERIIGLTEAANTAVMIQQYEKAQSIINEIGHIVERIGEIPKVARKSLNWLLYKSSWSKLFNIPFEVPAQASLTSTTKKSTVGIDAASKEVATALLGTEPVTYMVNRVAHLTEGSRQEVVDLIGQARKDGLWRFPKDFLANVATLTEAEFKAYVETVPPGLENVYLCRFYEKARTAIRKNGYNVESLKSETPVLFLSQQKPAFFVVEKGKPKPSVSVTDAGDFYVDVDPRVIRSNFRPYPWISDAFSVGGHATLGALTFVGAKNVVQLVLPEPRNNAEALAQGHTVLLTAMSADAAMQRGATWYVNRGYARTPGIPAPFSWSALGGGVGSGMFAWRAIAGTSEIMGADPESAEWIGLIGTGVVFGGYRPLIKAVSPSVYQEIAVMNPAVSRQILSRGGVVVYSSSAASKIATVERAVSKGGLVYLAADLGLGVVDAIVDWSLDDVDSAIRNMEYVEMKRYVQDRTYWGNSSDVNWLEQTGYTLYAIADTIVPPAIHKLSGDIVGSDWRKWKRAEYDKMVYQHHYQNAVKYAYNTASRIEYAFANIVGDAIWNPEAPNIEEVLLSLVDQHHSSSTSEMVQTLSSWQYYARRHLTDNHQYWLFDRGVVKSGKVKDLQAFVYWQEKRLLTVLDKVETLVKELQVADDGDRAAVKNALKVLKGYRDGIKVSSYLYSIKLGSRYALQQGSKKAEQMPLVN